MINLPYLECPHCNSSHLISWGSYTRGINYIDNKSIKYELLKIKRVKCKICGKTHALIPIPIIPYKTSILDIILSSISNDEITINYSIDTVNKWNKEFNHFLPYLETMLNNISKLKIINELKSNIKWYYYLFYKQNNLILMLTKKSLFNIVPF